MFANKKIPGITPGIFFYAFMRLIMLFRRLLTVAVEQWQCMEMATMLIPLALRSKIFLSRSDIGAFS